MKRTLILGDIHGRTIWKDIIGKEQPHQIIFLGDYVGTHDNISAQQQIENLEEILALKESRPDDIILLRGNHDLQHLGYWWAECNQLSPQVQYHLSSDEYRQRFLSITQWIHEFSCGEQKILCSHAGVSAVWLSNTGIGSVKRINEHNPSELFSFRPGRFSDYNGESCTQPCTWIRPKSLSECAVEGYVHIVGHTPQEAVTHERINDHTEIWLADALGHGGYLVLEDEKFIIRSLQP